MFRGREWLLVVIEKWRKLAKRRLRGFLENTFRPPAEKILGCPGKIYEPLLSVRGAEGNPSRVIFDLITSGQPICISRFGRTELQVVQRWRSKKLGGFGWQILDSLASGDPEFYFRRARRLLEGTGIAPLSDASVERFYELTVAALQEIDVLGSWAPGESWFAEELSNARIVRLTDLEPYRHEQPWSTALRDKKVLVIHPYVESIKSQVENHGDKIFGKRGVLPPFKLTTYRPPQSYFGEIRGAEDWFSHLNRMVDDIADLDFDIAIIGAGPFGMPLAASIKRIGRQAIHLGGATQLLFGIHGNRWTTDNDIISMLNEYWTKPRASETPPIANKIEYAAYW